MTRRQLVFNYVLMASVVVVAWRQFSMIDCRTVAFEELKRQVFDDLKSRYGYDVETIIYGGGGPSRLGPMTNTTTENVHASVQSRIQPVLEVPTEATRENDSKQRRRPYLVFHVGPPKTATTSLQVDLTRLNATLALDNYHYAGRYYYPKWSPKMNKMAPNRVDSDLNKISRHMFKPSVCKASSNLTTCVASEFRKALEPWKGTNILISDEGYNAGFKQPEYYEAMRAALADDWEIVIVVAYRRFFQWLPSDMFQRYRMDKIKGELNWKNHWPGLEGSPGEKVTLMFPFYYKRWFDMGHRYTDFTVDNVKDSFPVRILNLHEGEGSLRTRFLCHVLPDAPRSCEESKRRDRENDISNINDAQGALHVNYDMLTTGAAEQGLIDRSRFERRAIREALRNFTEHQLGKTHWDFDLKCPEPHQVDELLTVSLALEVKCLGKQAAEKLEADTRAAYQEDLENHKFCEVDANATLKMEPWKGFFAQYASSDK